MITDPLTPGRVTVRTHREAREELTAATRTLALAWAAATAERYPGADITIRVHQQPWRDAFSSGIHWVADLVAEWSETYADDGPQPRDLEELRDELARIDDGRYRA